MYTEVHVAIDDLLLDQENPRMDSSDSQSQALRGLIRLNVKHFQKMMLSIKAHGLDPGDLFYLVDESAETGVEGYTVIDGNRRLGALKILRQPTLLTGTGAPEKIVTKLREAAVGFDRATVGEERSCILFESRADAEDWILRRHGRDLGGEERISWGPLEIQRFQGDRSVLDIIEFMERNGGYTAEEWAEVRSKLQRKSYALRRFLDSKIGITNLGLGEEKDGREVIPTSTRSPKFLSMILRKLLDDVASGAIDTRQYNKAWQIKEYFDNLPIELQPTSDGEPSKATRFTDLDIEPDEEPEPAPAPPPAPPPPPTNPAPRIRDTLSPKKVEFKLPINSKGQQLVREAMRLKLRDAPLSAAFILRGFIQFVVDTYMIENEISFWKDNHQLELHVRADTVIEHLVSSKIAKRSNLSAIKRKLAEKASKNPSSIQALNDYHHDQYAVPDPDALRAGWDDATALFVAVLGRAN